MRDPLRDEIGAVVANGNCAGCGVCGLLSNRVELRIDPDSGFLRPSVDAGAEAEPEASDEVRRFRSVCPGIQVSAPSRPSPGGSHPELGGYVSVWQGWANDPAVRLAGSSGGVLTALGAWLIETGQTEELLAASSDPKEPIRSVAVGCHQSGDVVASAGSRYAPVSPISLVNWEREQVIVGKPCEVSGIARLEAEVGRPPALKLSFFCAGTPTQHATDALVEELGTTPDELDTLRYRGNGWPGSFEITTKSGRRSAIPYSEAWGRVLGRRIQTRCRLCADGTGVLADVSVGDYWQVDERGYPLFSESDGRSAVIARTQRGHDLLLAAAHAGVLTLEPLSIDDVAKVQPAQLKRQRTVFTRLLARRLMGKKVPRYRGFALFGRSLRHPVLSSAHFVGTIVRTRK